MEIENIIFDLGGVLLKLDFQATYTRMSDILSIPFQPDQLSPEIHKLLTDFETGSIGTEVFIWNLQRMATGKVPEGNQIAEAWNAMLLGWNPQIFDMLERLGKHYKVFLLSNTNALHLQWIHNNLRIRFGISDWETQFFYNTYYSHLIGYRKPDPAIFKFVGEKEQLIPQKTLFIDDLQANIDGASESLWHTYLHNPEEDIVKIIESELSLL